MFRIFDSSGLLSALLSCVYLVWWRFVLLVSPRGHHTYLHIRWRLYQERTNLSNFLSGRN